MRPHHDRDRGLGLRGWTATAGTLAVSLLIAGPARADIIELFCVIDAPQETPPNGSPGTGSATMTIDTVANTVDFNITFSGTGAPNNAHIHGSAAPGVPGGIMFPLPSFTSPIIGTWNYGETQEPTILNGLTYVNIHTATFGGGEIRGQVVNANSYCFGDGSGTACPCVNPDSEGRGCRNSSTIGGILFPHGPHTTSPDGLEFTALNLLAGQPALLFSGLNAVGGGNGTVFGDGLRCAGTGVVRLGITTPASTTNATGLAHWGPGLQAIGGWTVGDTRFFQAWYRDPADVTPCDAGFNLSNGIELSFVAP